MGLTRFRPAGGSGGSYISPQSFTTQRGVAQQLLSPAIVTMPPVAGIVVLQHPLTIMPASPRFGIPQGFTGRNGQPIAGFVFHQLGVTMEYYDALMRTPMLRTQMVDGQHASMHFSISSNGAIHQYIDPTNTAWAIFKVANPTWTLPASFLNILPDYYTINIGLESSAISLIQLQAASDLLAWLAYTLNVPISAATVAAHVSLDNSFTSCFGSDAASLTTIISGAQSILVAGNLATPTLFASIYTLATLNAVVGITQINATNKIFDDIPPHVATPAVDWAFVAPFDGIYSFQTRMTLVAQQPLVSIGYSINAGSLVLIGANNQLYDAPEHTFLKHNDVVRFYVNNGTLGAVAITNIRIGVVRVYSNFTQTPYVPPWAAAAAPSISPDANNQISLRPNGMYVSPLGNITISPNAGNIAQSLGNGLYVPTPPAPAISADSGNIVTLHADGLYAGQVPPIVSPDSGNELSQHANGLYAPAQTVPTLSVDAGNQITAHANGLYVAAGAGLTIADTATVDQTLTAGLLTASVKISADPHNAVSAHADGMYVGKDAGSIYKQVTLSGNDGDVVQVNANVLAYDQNFAGGTNVATPSTNWTFTAPLVGLYLLKLSYNTSLNGSGLPRYSINGGSTVIMPSAGTSGIVAMDTVFLNANDTVKFYLTIVATSGTVILSPVNVSIIKL